MNSPVPPITSRARKAFSIPELLVVLIIIGIATTGALLAYGNVRKGNTVSSAAEKIKSTITQARTRAIASNLPSSVVFDLNNKVVWVDDLTASGAVRTPKIIPPESLGDDVIIADIQIASNLYTDGTRRAIFRPDGTNPLVTVNLRRTFDDAAQNANFYAVQIYPTSAEAKVWPRVRR